MTLPPYPGSPEGDEPERPDTTPPAPPAPPAYPTPPAYPAPGAPGAPGAPAGPGGTPYPPTHYPGGAYPAPGSFGTPGANELGRPWSATAIASFVSSLTCCLGFVAIPLGIIGIIKTKGGQAKGRWMAIVGLVLGLISVIVLAVLIGTGAWFFSKMVTPDNASVGQCVDVSLEDDEGLLLLESDCEPSHEAEVLGTVTLTAEQARRYNSDADSLSVQICGPVAEDVVDTDAIDPADYELLLLAFPEASDGDVADGDEALCLIRPLEGKMTDRVVND